MDRSLGAGQQSRRRISRGDETLASDALPQDMYILHTDLWGLYPFFRTVEKAH